MKKTTWIIIIIIAMILIAGGSYFIYQLKGENKRKRVQQSFDTASIIQDFKQIQLSLLMYFETYKKYPANLTVLKQHYLVRSELDEKPFDYCVSNDSSHYALGIQKPQITKDITDNFPPDDYSLVVENNSLFDLNAVRTSI